MLKRLLIALCLCAAVTLFIPAHAASALSSSDVPILLYHHIDNHTGQWHVSPQKFQQELEYLADSGYHTTTMAVYMDAMQNQTQLPNKSVVLTFDDGYGDVYQNAFPLLKKYGMTGTFFIITGLVGAPGYLTWDQIAEMNQAGMEIGAHTVHHPFLTRLTPIHAFLEIYKSRIDLEGHLHTPVSVFAYPYNDHNSLVVELTRLAGFKGAVIVGAHRGDTLGDIFRIPRITILSGERLRIFELVLEPRPRSQHPFQGHLSR